MSGHAEIQIPNTCMYKYTKFIYSSSGGTWDLKLIRGTQCKVGGYRGKEGIRPHAFLFLKK